MKTRRRRWSCSRIRPARGRGEYCEAGYAAMRDDESCMLILLFHSHTSCFVPGLSHRLLHAKKSVNEEEMEVLAGA